MFMLPPRNMNSNQPYLVCRETADWLEQMSEDEWREHIAYSFPKGIGHVVAYLHGEPKINDHRTNTSWKKRQADRLGLTRSAFSNLRWCGGVNGGRGARDGEELAVLLRAIADRHDAKNWNREQPHHNRMREAELEKLARKLFTSDYGIIGLGD